MASGVKYKSISSIPVKVIGTAVGSKSAYPEFRWKRRLLQTLLLILGFFIPARGLFLLHPGGAAFVFLRRPIWFACFFFGTGGWLIFVGGFLLFVFGIMFDLAN